MIEEVAQASKIIPQERVMQRAVEQGVEVPGPQMDDEDVQVSKIIPQEGVM